MHSGEKRGIIPNAPAGVMELVDVLDSKSSAARRAGSSPATGTNWKYPVSRFWGAGFFMPFLPVLSSSSLLYTQIFKGRGEYQGRC